MILGLKVLMAATALGFGLGTVALLYPFIHEWAVAATVAVGYGWGYFARGVVESAKEASC